MDDNHHEILSLRSLNLIFARFNAVLFKNTLPQYTKILRKNDNDLILTPGLSLPLKARLSLGTFAITARITHSPTHKIDRTMPPQIFLPSRGTFSINSSPGDDVSALLEAAIGLYLQWYSCQNPSCINHITACGKAYRGHAWQKIANLLEKFEMMSDMQNLIGSQVRLRRHEEFVRELSYWDRPRLLVSLGLIRELGLVAWTVEDFVYAAEEERRKRVTSKSEERSEEFDSGVIDIDAQRKHNKTHAPFSRGTRICLGMNLAWAEMYLLLAALVQRFDFQFEGATSKDFECESDQFIIGTSGKGVLNAVVASCR
ncbi:uncharacterized protein EAF01_010841 [Botrytis porri]|uniref:Cytochrome P450 n=1 Tax=Botrytis porri TaxID=87229 RepID=A0A4Z1KLG9_9HELO|nr:uncharacterized protein EAF01_010841 [Botrytis porri]KAF7889348.1 hypothetical protein EAF01_010841 [Botrytis porri]TGO86186.1 hypothetical protein BPOR_0326g00090 [Botrytis porri]